MFNFHVIVLLFKATWNTGGPDENCWFRLHSFHRCSISCISAKEAGGAFGRGVYIGLTTILVV
jgi:hypothetical protein